MPPSNPIKTTLRILATSDLHMHIRGFDYAANTTVPNRGLSRIASAIEQARAQMPEGLCVLFDNGDMLQGTALADTLRTEPDNHPMAASLNALGYDAVGLGNHDFDFGVNFLDRVIAQIQAPVISTNLACSELVHVLPWTILEREIPCNGGQNHPVRIGVLSVLPQQTLQWNRAQIPSATQISPLVAAASTGCAQLKSLGADIVVLLAHCGFGTVSGQEDTENVALQMGGIDGIDAIVSGHTHGVFPNADQLFEDGVDAIAGTLLGTPAAMPGSGGSHLAQIDLHLIHQGEKWHVKSHQSAAIPVTDQMPENAVIHDLSECVHSKTLERLEREVGHVHHSVHSYFSLLQTSAEMELIADAMHKTIRAEATGTEFENLPLLSSVALSVNVGSIGAHNYVCVQKRPLLYREVLQMCPYEDHIWAVQRTGAELREWLERSAVVYNHLHAAYPDQTLIRKGAPLFNFDVLFGISYTIDPSQPPKYGLNGELINPQAKRAHNLTFQGKAVFDDDLFLVATTNYRAGGGGRFPHHSASRVSLRSDVTVQNALLSHLKNLSNEAPFEGEKWKIETASQCTAMFDTAPSAPKYLNDLQDFSPEFLKITEAGFARLRLHL